MLHISMKEGGGGTSALEPLLSLFQLHELKICLSYTILCWFILGFFL